MSMADVLMHFGHLVILGLLFARDAVWMRFLLLAAHGLVAHYALMLDLQAVAYWQLLFIVINLALITLAMSKRNEEKIPQELWPVFKQYFSVFQGNEFLKLWRAGETHSANSELILREGEPPGRLIFLLEGQVSIRKGDQEIAVIEPGQFIAEMAFLTGDPASADAHPVGNVRYVSWTSEALKKLTIHSEEVVLKLNGVIGADLVRKIKTTSSKMASMSAG